jgi:hypothetical protein
MRANPGATCGSLEWGGQSYKLRNMRLHVPSEHTVNGMHYPMEIEVQFCTGACVLDEDKDGKVKDGATPASAKRTADGDDCRRRRLGGDADDAADDDDDDDDCHRRRLGAAAGVGATPVRRSRPPCRRMTLHSEISMGDSFGAGMRAQSAGWRVRAGRWAGG